MESGSSVLSPHVCTSYARGERLIGGWRYSVVGPNCGTSVLRNYKQKDEAHEHQLLRNVKVKHKREMNLNQHFPPLPLLLILPSP
jgi:hypothetical protein